MPMKISVIRNFLLIGMALLTMSLPKAAKAADGCTCEVRSSCAICYCERGGCWWWDNGCDNFHDTNCGE